MRFLEILADKFYNENDLSDFVWALFKDNSQFTNYFLKFLGCNESSDGVEIEREYKFPDDNKRIDFYLHKGNNLRYYIENKIFDIGNYHFEEYSKLINESNAVKVLISAHIIDPQNSEIGKRNGWKIYFWQDFISLLENEIDKLDPLLKDFVKYLKKVCMVKEIEQIRFDNKFLKSIFYFNNLLDKVIMESNNSLYKYEWYYKQTRAYDNHYIGKYYIIKSQDTNISFPAIGMIFNSENPICIWLDQDWNKNIYDYFKEHKDQIKEENKLDIDNSSIIFYMNQKEYEDFAQSDKEGQYKILKDFFVRVNNLIEKSYENITSHRTT